MKRVLLSLALFCALCGLSTRARAETYNVSAVVPYRTPAVATTIDASLAGLSTTTQSQRIFGTCEVASPPYVVSILRSGVVVGSTACSPSGTYQVDISLVLGTNGLTAKTSNLNGEYGPDSAVTTITYSLPPVPQTVQETQQATSSLALSTEQPFIPLAVGQTTATLSVVVGGGESPYLIELNWGDGTVEQKKVDAPGTYSFTHEYAKTTTYQAKAVVTDVLGVSRTQYFAVVSAAASKPADTTTSSTGNSSLTAKCGSWASKWWSWVLLIIGFILGLVVGLRLAGRKHVAVAAKPKSKKA